MNKKIKLDTNKIISQIKNLPESFKSTFVDLSNSDEGLTILNSFSNIDVLFDYGVTSNLIIPYVLQLMNLDKRKRCSKHIPDIEKKISEADINGELNQELIKSEMGRHIFDQTIRTILDEINEEKIETQKALLINTYTRKKRDDLFYEMCENTLKNLDPIDLLILKAFYDPRESLEFIFDNPQTNYNRIPDRNIPENLNIFFQFDPVFFDRSREKLYDNKLISLPPNSSKNVARGNFRPSQREKTINIVTEEYHKIMTEFGIKFVEMIIQKENNQLSS